MKLPESLLSRVILAYVPFLAYGASFNRMCFAAACVAVVFWVTVFFFWFIRRFFPERFLKQAFFLWLLAWAQAVWYGTSLEPWWMASVFFLTPVSFLEQGNQASHVRVFSRVLPRYFWERFLAGFGFLGFVMALAVLQEVLTQRFKILMFYFPPGMLLLLTGAAFLWKNQSFHRSQAAHYASPRKKKSGARPQRTR